MQLAWRVLDYTAFHGRELKRLHYLRGKYNLIMYNLVMGFELVVGIFEFLG